MNREIKFRAWDNDNQLFSFLSFSDLRRLAETIDSYEDYFSHAYFTKNDEKTGNPLLMQFTGLQDKNGVNIYEGDIMDWGKIGKVTWNDGGFWQLSYFDDKPQLFPVSENATVIGNIYQNPELLTP